MPQQPLHTPQQEAIQVVRTRYEQGILTFDQFEYSLNALLLAQTPEECQQVVDELPSTAAADVLRAPVPQPPTGTPAVYHLVGTVGELKRMRRPWHLEPHTKVRMWLGQVKLDLSLASLTLQGVLEVVVPIGEVVIYVPREVHVTLSAFALIGEVQALGEERAGVFARLHEEVFPAESLPTASAPHVELRLKTIIGSVKVIRVDGPVLALKDMIKEAASQLLLATLDVFKQHRNDRTLPK